MAGPIRYVSHDDDSGRWDGFPYREGDIVISTRSKSGTTWMQMICALLVFRSPVLPAPLSELSPWLDHTIEPVADVVARLERQRHRRFVKTHTPLDGIPLDDRATYIVVARHPLDMAVSLYHHVDNIDRARMAELTGGPVTVSEPRPSLRDWLLAWTQKETTAIEQPDSLVGVLHHVSDARHRAAVSGNVLLVHYADLLDDLEGSMRALANRLALPVPEDVWPALVEAATFTRMRDRSKELTPNPLGVLKDDGKFFRVGRSGQGRAVLEPHELAAYERRVASLADPELIRWLHR
ncbi:MAG: sulfotransferase domain-containing protein [Nocardioidaceae bacterium]